MLETKIKTVREISRSINTIEARGADNFERSVGLMTEVIAARKRHDLPASFAADALSAAAAATLSFAEGNRQIASAHRLLASDQIEFGVPRMGGDDCPWPTVTPADDERSPRHLQAVA